MKKATIILVLICMMLLIQVFNQRFQIAELRAEIMDYESIYTADPDENF